MTTRAQPILSAGQAHCADRAGRFAVHAFGPFDPFGAEWKNLFSWEFGETCSEEWLWSIRVDTLSSVRTGGPVAPVADPRQLPPSGARGHLRYRVLTDRIDGKLGSDFFCDSSGVDLYANFVRLELWAPASIGSADSDAQASQAGLGVLDEYVSPAVTRLGSSLRPTATLHTYAQAATPHPVPPKAQRYTVLTGDQPELYVGTTSVIASAPSSGSIGGVDGLQVPNDAVIVWEVAP